MEWRWEYRNAPTPWTQFSTLNNPSFTFPAQGTYEVRLTVTDNDGNSNGPVIHAVNILAPVAAFSGTPPLTGPAPLGVVFTDSSTNTPTSWRWEYNETSGGGWIQFSTARNPAHSFPAGTYDIRLTATNAIGSDTMTQYGYITAIPLPVASFTANQTSGVIPSALKFTDTTTNNPTSWIWEYNETSAGGWTQFSTTQNPIHTFSTGKYDIRFTATNAGGSNTMTKFGYITVTAVPITHTITASAAGGGSNCTIWCGKCKPGGSQTFAITPNPGYHIVNVIVDACLQVPIPEAIHSTM